MRPDIRPEIPDRIPQTVSSLRLSTGSADPALAGPRRRWPGRIRSRSGAPAVLFRGGAGGPSALERRRLPGLPGLAGQAGRLLCPGLFPVVAGAGGAQVSIRIGAARPEWAEMVNLCAWCQVAERPTVAADAAIAPHDARAHGLPAAAPGASGCGGGQAGRPGLERGQLAAQHGDHGGPLWSGCARPPLHPGAMTRGQLVPRRALLLFAHLQPGPHRPGWRPPCAGCPVEWCGFGVLRLIWCSAETTRARTRRALLGVVSEMRRR